ncbi:hypothetical protein GGS26DRAFT_604132 [Hypomontagnella submonticulosa]|nr:hypothetical protein GGS26DRAFT_604132 [Hypomontagnella submonticulosa]
MAPTLETLPIIIQERICECLTECDTTFRSLRALSLTTKTCCAFSEKQRFSQIRLVVRELPQLKDDLVRLNRLLSDNEAKRVHFIRRLKISETTLQEERDCAEEFTLRRDQERKVHFALHDFCQPRLHQPYIRENDALRGPDCAETYEELSGFIVKLSGLRDLIWTCKEPPRGFILTAAHAKNCRLHIHYFSLDSLEVTENDDEEPEFSFTDPDTQALATSPSLYSIGFVSDASDASWQNGDRPEEAAVQNMVARLAPNLAHVWMREYAAGYEVQGADSADSDQEESKFCMVTTSLGSLQSLTLEAGDLEFPPLGENIDLTAAASSIIWGWRAHADFSNLCCLTLYWQVIVDEAAQDISEEDVFRFETDTMYDALADLGEMARRGELKSLHTLALDLPSANDEVVQDALTRLLENLNPLKSLDLCVAARGSAFGPEAFEAALHRHGPTLRKIRLSYPVFTEDTTQSLVNRCPNLEEIEILTSRTKGDARETGIYRALSRLPRLTRACLRLRYSIEAKDEESGGEYGDDDFGTEEEMDDWHTHQGIYKESVDEIRDAFLNAAVDASLVRSIYDLISPNGKLACLEVRPVYKYRGAKNYYAAFTDILKWIEQRWVYEKDYQGIFSLRELDGDQKGWASNSHRSRYKIEASAYEPYLGVWDALWPRRTLYEGKQAYWESLPLSQN